MMTNNDLDRAELLEKYSFSTLDRVMAWVSVVLGYLFIRVIPVRENRLAGALFLLVLWGCVYAWLYCSGVRPTVRSLVFVGGAVAMIPSIVVTSDEFLIWWLYLGELVVLMYFISTAGGNSVERRLGGLFAVDVAGAVFTAPLGDLRALPGAIFVKRPGGLGKKIGKTLLWILLGLCLAVIPTFIITLMLSFDQGFNRLMDNIFNFDIRWSEQVWRRIVAIVFGIPVAVYGFGAVIASRRHSISDKMTGESCESSAQRARCLPAALVYAAVTPILAVYVIFFISQWEVYMWAFTGRLPDGFIYSEYAREGFFQLVCVCAINACIMLGVHLFVQRKSKATQILLKIYIIVMSVMTLILVATALSRMALYIKAYGLTLDRIHASWFMIVLAVAFVLSILKQIWTKLRFTSVLLGCVAVMFAVLIYGNANAIVANYNADAYLDGRLESVDVREINDMEYAGIDALMRLSESAPDSDVRHSAEKYLQVRRAEIEDSKISLWGFNFPEVRARKIINE